MAIRQDIWAYLSDYTGKLTWAGYTEEYSGTAIPTIVIPLYVKEASIPVRKPKITEISTIQTKDPGTKASTTTNVLFYGAPDMLTTQLSGWTVTPTANGQWAPVDANGTALNWGQLSYNDIISYFIAGRFNRNSAGAWRRRDPTFYASPRGQVYSNPIISVFQPSAAIAMKKQPFEMTLLLEA